MENEEKEEQSYTKGDLEANGREGNEVEVRTEWLEGFASRSAEESDPEANVSNLNLHVWRKERWTMDGRLLLTPLTLEDF